MDITIPHHLPKEEALNRIKKLLTETRNEHGDKISNLREDWNGDTGKFSFTAMGFDVAGNLEVTPQTVELKGKLPIALTLFKGKIAHAITEKATALLSRP